MANINWSGAAGDNSWNTAGNWVGGVVPGAADFVFIGAIGGSGSISGIIDPAPIRITFNSLSGPTPTLSAALVSSDTQISTESSVNLTISGNISGTGFRKQGLGTATLVGTNIFTGQLSAEGGTLFIGTSNSLGQPTSFRATSGDILDLGGNAYTLSGSLDFALGDGDIINGSIDAASFTSSGGSLSVSISLLGSGGFTCNGGSPVISGSNTYSGGTTVSAGFCRVDGASPVGSGSVTLSGGSLYLNAAYSAPNLIDVVGGSLSGVDPIPTSILGALTAGFISQSLTGSDNLVKTGPGTLSLGSPASATTAAVQLYISDGVLLFGNTNAIGSFTSIVIGSGATFRKTSASSAVYSGPIGSAVGGSGNIELTAGTLTLNGASSFSGATTVSGGTLVCGDVNALGSSGVTLFGGMLDLNGYAINATSIIDSGGTLLNFAAYTGEVFVPGGTLVVPATAVGTYVASVGGTVDLGSNNPPLTQLRYNGGTLVNIGFYRGELRNDAAYTAPYDLRCSLFCAEDFDLGGFQVAPASGSLSVYVENGYTLSNGTVSNCDVSLDSGNVSALIAGTSTVTVNSAGSTNTLSGANTYSGGTSLVDGTLVAAAAGAFGTGDITLDGGVLDLDGYAVTADVTFNGGDIVNAASYAGAVTISPAVTFTVPVGIVLSGTANVSPTGKLAIGGQHTGIINNDGEVEIDTSTAADPPVNEYNGACGSTYAVRAA